VTRRDKFADVFGVLVVSVAIYAGYVCASGLDVWVSG